MLKVIAKGEVAQHLKVGAVAGGFAHPLDVGGAGCTFGRRWRGGQGVSTPKKVLFSGAMPELISRRLASSLGHQGRFAG